MKYKSRSNMSKIGRLELGYLHLNFPHFGGFVTITRANIIRFVSSFGNRKVPRKYRSNSNMSQIGPLELGYLPFNFFNFLHVLGVATITQANFIRSVSNLGHRNIYFLIFLIRCP